MHRYENLYFHVMSPIAQNDALLMNRADELHTIFGTLLSCHFLESEQSNTGELKVGFFYIVIFGNKVYTLLRLKLPANSLIA